MKNPSQASAGNTLRSEKGVVHFFGMIVVLGSIYSTYLLLKQEAVADELVSVVTHQKKKIDMLELRLQVLEFRKTAH